MFKQNNLKKLEKSGRYFICKVASLGVNTLNFTDLGSPYGPGTPHSVMEGSDTPHTPKYTMDGVENAPGKSAFVELQQHG